MVKAFLHVVVILPPGCSSPFLEDEVPGPLSLLLKRPLVILMSQGCSSGSLISWPLDLLPLGSCLPAHVALIPLSSCSSCSHSPSFNPTVCAKVTSPSCSLPHVLSCCRGWAPCSFWLGRHMGIWGWILMPSFFSHKTPSERTIMALFLEPSVCVCVWVYEYVCVWVCVSMSVCMCVWVWVCVWAEGFSGPSSQWCEWAHCRYAHSCAIHPPFKPF